MSDFRISDEQWWDDVRFVCTDRGQHASREITKISRDRETGELSEVGTGQSSSGRTVQRRAKALRAAPGLAWELPACPSCGRCPRLAAERMRELVARLVESSLRTFDASWLD